MKLAPLSHLSDGLEKTGSIEKMKTVRQEPPTIKVKMYLRSMKVNCLELTGDIVASEHILDKGYCASKEQYCDASVVKLDQHQACLW